jgi:TP901 family phage tail tape measure protein
MSSENLADSINFLNAVENQTVVSLDDITTAIPKVAPVIQQLGGDVKDLAFFMAAMKEGGINASEGANALKSGLAALINPTGKASDMLKSYGINANAIVEQNKGDLKAILEGINKAEIGINPVAEADSIRLVLPALTQDRRKDLAKQAKRMADEAKVAIRNVRKDFLSMVTDDEYTEDLKKRIESDMTKVHDQVIAQIDAAFVSKEKEILTL